MVVIPDVLHHRPLVPRAEKRGREDDGVERDVVLAHELHHLDVLWRLPPPLPLWGVAGGDRDVPTRTRGTRKEVPSGGKGQRVTQKGGSTAEVAYMSTLDLSTLHQPGRVDRPMMSAIIRVP